MIIALRLLLPCICACALYAEQAPDVVLDKDQHITQVTLASGDRWMYAWDARGHLTQVAITPAQGDPMMWTCIVDLAGTITAITGPAGTVDLQHATARWDGLSLVLTAPGNAQHVLIRDPRDGQPL